MPISPIASTTSGQTSSAGLLAGGLGADVRRRVALEERLRHLRATGVVGADEQDVLHRWCLLTTCRQCEGHDSLGHRASLSIDSHHFNRYM